MQYEKVGEYAQFKYPQKMILESFCDKIIDKGISFQTNPPTVWMICEKDNGYRINWSLSERVWGENRGEITYLWHSRHIGDPEAIKLDRQQKLEREKRKQHEYHALKF